MSLGTSTLIADKNEFFKTFISDYVTVLAMNNNEAMALTDQEDSLLACESALELADMVLITVGEKGLYMGAYSDEDRVRPTKDPLHSKSITEYNKFEYSRAQRKQDCESPVKIYSHINPFLGGPGVIKNTNGAGDAALSAVLHDLAANDHHKNRVPSSTKHEYNALSYSSLAQICKYANRVSYEVLIRNSPRLTRGLPEKEDCLEESYWDK